MVWLARYLSSTTRIHVKMWNVLTHAYNPVLRKQSQVDPVAHWLTSLVYSVVPGFDTHHCIKSDVVPEAYHPSTHEIYARGPEVWSQPQFYGEFKTLFQNTETKPYKWQDLRVNIHIPVNMKLLPAAQKAVIPYNWSRIIWQGRHCKLNDAVEIAKGCSNINPGSRS